jgi:ornithine cyclodeaminase/alanine dehydrogenase-like protein (mu-crystallin family)
VLGDPAHGLHSTREQQRVTIIITDDDVRRLLPMPDCIEAMRVAFRDFANGSAVNRPRMRYLAQHPDPGRKYLANVHVGAVPSAGIACVRAGSQIIRPPGAGNDRRLYENPQAFNWGIVILYSIETAEPLALMHEFHLSGIRVGATTAVGVDQMARPDAATLGLFGTGKQARCALEAIAVVRPLRRVNVYSPSAEHREDFARAMARDGVDVVAVADPKAVVAGADIVCCATTAMKPVFDGDWLEDGQVVVSIANSDVTNKRSEVDRRTYERARAVIINDWESVIDNDQTELLEPLEQGVIRKEQIHELGDLLIGKTRLPAPAAGPEGIVYYKNNSGLAIQFAAAGGILYRKAIAEGNNKTIPTEWLGSDLSAYYKAGFRPSP